MSALAVIAKAPAPGRSKTRLCPPCTPSEAARLAAAALQDTLDAVARTPATRRLLVLDGAHPVPPGFSAISQRGAGLAERLAHAFADAGAPLLLIGMDTPQVTPAQLQRGLELLRTHDAVLGPATDGGYWAIGLRRPDARVFAEVPMSVRQTCRVQRARLRALGLRVAELPPLTDVDTIDDARTVAAQMPHGRFAAELGALRLDAVPALA